MLLYGRIQKHGLYGVRKDTEAALTLFNSKISDGMCLYEAGKLIEEKSYGNDGKYMLSMALRKYQDAAAQGIPEAMCDAARFYEEALGVNMNIARAVSFYKAAAIRGSARALAKLEKLQRDHQCAKDAYDEVRDKLPKTGRRQM